MPDRRCSQWPSLAERFEANVNREGPTIRPDLGPCHVWTAATASPNGYGVIYGQGKRWVAHRLSWTYAVGPVPAGLQVLHRCDNRPCVNPGHLFLGTQLVNMQDMNAKGRRNDVRAVGERHPNAKVTGGQVREIRHRFASGETKTALAVEFGLSRQSVSQIVLRETWRHVSP